MGAQRKLRKGRNDIGTEAIVVLERGAVEGLDPLRCGRDASLQMVARYIYECEGSKLIKALENLSFQVP